MATTLIPANFFAIRKLDGFRVYVDSSRYMLCSGWGLWDESAQDWVAGECEVDGMAALKPWSFKTRKAAQFAVKDGLINGYKTVE